MFSSSSVFSVIERRGDDTQQTKCKTTITTTQSQRRFVILWIFCSYLREEEGGGYGYVMSYVVTE